MIELNWCLNYCDLASINCLSVTCSNETIPMKRKNKKKS